MRAAHYGGTGHTARRITGRECLLQDEVQFFVGQWTVGHMLLRCRVKERRHRPEVSDQTAGVGTACSPDIPQHRFHRLALVRRERGLRRDGIADFIPLDRKPGLDAGG
jgi:hypothetical protein